MVSLVTLPFIVKTSWRIAHWRPHDVAWMAAGTFTVMSTVMSLNEVMKHLQNYSSPRLQRHIVRILFMPPVYAIDCFVAMRFNSLGTCA